MTVLTERKTEGDLIRHEYRNDYCEVGAKVYNRSNAALTISDAMGYPVIADESVAGAYQFAHAGEEASVVGLMIYTKSITALADNGYVMSRVLVRGPAAIDKVWLPTDDFSDSYGTFDIAAIVAALAALSPPILAKGESPQTTTQTT